MTGRAVRRLKLSHYRSYHGLDLELDGRPVALFGANGAGKTNLLEAVSMLSPGRGMRRARGEELPRQPESIGWRMFASITGDNAEHSIMTGAEAGAGRMVEIDEKASSQIALARICRVVWLVPVMDRLWVEGAAERRGFLDRVTMSLFPDHAKAALGYEKAMRERNRLLKDQVTDAGWYDAIERRMAEEGVRMTANRAACLEQLRKAQDAADTAFPHADLSIEMDSDWVSERDLALALADGRARDMAAGRTRAGPHRADLTAIYAAKGKEARICSTGEQKALLVSLILSNVRAIAAATSQPPIVLLDEVAAHLDRDRRAALYDEICALEAQAWMSGTGPELFEGMEGRAMFCAVTENDGASALRITDRVTA